MVPVLQSNHRAYVGQYNKLLLRKGHIFWAVLLLLLISNVAGDPYDPSIYYWTSEVPENVTFTMSAIHSRMPKELRSGGIINLTCASREKALEFVRIKGTSINGEREGINDWHLKRYPILREAAEKVAAYIKVPFHIFRMGLEMELLHYQSGHKGIIWHHDRGPGGHRMISGLLYLNDMEAYEGGATSFPKMIASDTTEASVSAPSAERLQEEMSTEGFNILPRAGQLGLWSNYYCSGGKCTPDEYKMHFSTPMVTGSARKFAVNIWFSCDNQKVAKEYSKWLREKKTNGLLGDSHMDYL